MTTTTLPITITLEVTGTFVPGNLHKVRDEEPQGDTFDNIDLDAVTIGKRWDGQLLLVRIDDAVIADILHTHREAVIEALLTEHSKSAP